MPPFLHRPISRTTVHQFSQASTEFSDQWTHPGDVFLVLLIRGGDIVARALAQLTGWTIGPPSFSFGWVAYSVNALASAVGENKLMPEPDCNCLVVNGKTGYTRANRSWILGRMVRDHDVWMHKDTRKKVESILREKWDELKAKAQAKKQPEPEIPTRAGLCVSIYKANPEGRVGMPVDNKLYMYSIQVAILQLGLAAIACGIFGDWGTLMITTCGILLSSATASLPQWKSEKWACRRLCKDNSDKNVFLTTGNGSQHVIVILGREGYLDLEDLAAGQAHVDATSFMVTRCAVIALAFLWIVLLITAARLNTWFLIAVGGIGILFNIFVGGYRIHPQSNGLPIEFVQVIGHTKAMKTLYEVEDAYPHMGRAMLHIFFPARLREDEQKAWEEYNISANAREAARRAGNAKFSTAAL